MFDQIIFYFSCEHISILLQKNKKMVQMIEPTKNYRLSDLVNGYIDRHHNKYRDSPSSSFFCESWPSSIGCEYQRMRKGVDMNISLLKSIIDRRNHNKSFLQNDTLVVHLRLGDVLDLPYYRDSHRKIAKLYVKPLVYYRRFNIPSNVRNAYIVTNESYRAYSYPQRSVYYLSNVTNILKQRGLHVRQYKGKSADEDLLFMARSIFFVKSGGGFSNLVSHMIHLYNHTVIG
tara:strand:+ start:783 stop:1475 length:693 start_codon:yes stop_codon:yes gene_type:complete